MFILRFLFSMLLISSCNSSGSFELDEEPQTFSNESIIGAWKYNDSYYGDVYLQFETDGTLRVFYNNEGEIIENAQWSIQDNTIITSGCTLFPDNYRMNVSEFDGSTFNIPPSSYDVATSTGRTSISVSRLFDEAGEPILHYSLFERNTYSDPRYDDGTTSSSEYQDNTSYSESYSQNNGNQTSVCSSCRGSGECSECYHTSKKSYLDNRCAHQQRSELKPGYIICNTCRGFGYFTTNLNCNCPDGAGWCYEKECYLSECADGWVPCRKCNYNGNGDNLGKCQHCNGSGVE